MTEANEPTNPSTSPPGRARPRRPSPEVILIGLIAAVIVAVAVGLVGLWWLRTTTYTVTAFLEVHPPDASIVAPKQVYGKEIIDRHKRTMAAVVKEPVVLAAAAADPRVTRTRWYDRHKADVVEALDRAVVVAPIPETSLIRLSMSGKNKNELADIVNAVADSFVRHARGDSQGAIGHDVGKLQEQREALTRRLDEVRRELAKAGPERTRALGKEASKLEETARRIDARLLEIGSDARENDTVSVRVYATPPE